MFIIQIYPRMLLLDSDFILFYFAYMGLETFERHLAHMTLKCGCIFYTK